MMICAQKKIPLEQLFIDKGGPLRYRLIGSGLRTFGCLLNFLGSDQRNGVSGQY